MLKSNLIGYLYAINVNFRNNYQCSSENNLEDFSLKTHDLKDIQKFVDDSIYCDPSSHFYQSNLSKPL